MTDRTTQWILACITLLLCVIVVELAWIACHV